MGTKLSSINRKLTINDFKEEEAKWYFRCNDWEICFWQTQGACGKMTIQARYVEGGKSYLKDEKILKWKPKVSKYEIKERNRSMWYWINKFSKYCNHG